MRTFEQFMSDECVINCEGCASCLRAALESLHVGEYIDLMINAEMFEVTRVSADQYASVNDDSDSYYGTLDALYAHIIQTVFGCHA